MDPHLLAALSAAGGTGAVGYAIYQLRLYLQYRARMKFARHVFDNTMSTDGLAGLTQLARAERPVISLRAPKEQTEASGGGGSG